jgi:hypothetical protein
MEEIDIRVIFRLAPAIAIPKIELAKNVLEQWRATYLQVGSAGFSTLNPKP